MRGPGPRRPPPPYPIPPPNPALVGYTGGREPPPYVAWPERPGGSHLEPGDPNLIGTEPEIGTMSPDLIPFVVGAIAGALSLGVGIVVGATLVR